MVVVTRAGRLREWSQGELRLYVVQENILTPPPLQKGNHFSALKFPNLASDFLLNFVATENHISLIILVPSMDGWREKGGGGVRLHGKW